MSKNNLDLQTFQIYQDDETHDSSAGTTSSAPKKKKFTLPSFKKKHKLQNSLDGNSDTDNEGPTQVDVDGSGKKSPKVSAKIKKSSASGNTDVIKGLAVGFGLLILFVAADIIMSL